MEDFSTIAFAVALIFSNLNRNIEKKLFLHFEDLKKNTTILPEHPTYGKRTTYILLW